MYNKIYEFSATVRGQPADMIMSSVSGHLLTHEFSAAFRNWQGCDPISLFDAPVRKICPENFIKVKQTLEREVKFNDFIIFDISFNRINQLLLPILHRVDTIVSRSYYMDRL